MAGSASNAASHRRRGAGRAHRLVPRRTRRLRDRRCSTASGARFRARPRCSSRAASRRTGHVMPSVHAEQPGIPRSLGSRPASTCPSIKKQPRLQKMRDHLGKILHPEPGNRIAWIPGPAGHQRHVRALPHTPFLRPHSPTAADRDRPAAGRGPKRSVGPKAQCAPQPGQVLQQLAPSLRRRLPNLRSRLRTAAVNTDWSSRGGFDDGRRKRASVARPNLPARPRRAVGCAAINDAAISRREGFGTPPRTASP